MTQEEKKTEKTISGIDVMRGVGVERAKPFWADAWHRVVIRRGAQAGLLWIGIVGFFAIFAPVVANGLPLWTVESIQLESGEESTRSFSPLFESLTSTDLLLLLGGILGPLLFFIPIGLTRQRKLGLITAAATIGGIIVVLIALLQYMFMPEDGSAGEWSPFSIWVSMVGMTKPRGSRRIRTLISPGLAAMLRRSPRRGPHGTCLTTSSLRMKGLAESEYIMKSMILPRPQVHASSTSGATTRPSKACGQRDRRA